MSEKLLFVDDDQKLLASIRRMFRDKFDIETAQSGLDGLEAIRSQGPFAVIVSDIKMPGMNGLEFLAQAREIDPEGVRMILTGYADLQNAMDAVNSGYVFRFLTKPCAQDVLERALDAGLEQFRLLKTREEMASLTRIKDAMEGIIHGFVNLVEARDPYTAGHQRSVRKLSLAIARKMGLDEDRLRGLHLAADVHDIGKVYVPAEFLNRPGRLTEEEFAIIRMHPGIGFDILSPVNFPWPVAEMVHQHHERLDGSGYPKGLKGDDILLESKILCVADVVDAISAHRPYRPGKGVDLALQEIRDNSGILYDEAVVEACLEVVEKDGFRLPE